MKFSARSHANLIAGSYRELVVAPLRHDPADRRQRIESRIGTLKRRFGIASILGFGALFGVVTQHAVGSQKHEGAATRTPVSSPTPATSFFDANDPGYSFDDDGFRAASHGAQPPQPPQSAGSGQPPVAQSGGS